MIISIFVIDQHTSKRLYRASSPMSSSKMNYYLTEFNNLANNPDGFIEKDTYNYVYISNNVQKIGMQTTKDHSPKQAYGLLKYIEQNSTEDIYDMLFTIDNTLFGGIGIKLDLPTIKEMDSQEEKIHKMMLENKKLEMAQREKENKIRAIQDQNIVSKQVESVISVKPKKIEKSLQPVLLIIKEKIKLEINKENKIKENNLNGEMDLIISDAKYRQLQIKMKNLRSSLKFSPYLDKNALKKQILRFEKDRGLNKNIPLLKWSGECNNIPLFFEFWSDEDEGKFINIVEFRANINIKEIVIKFNMESASDIEMNEEYKEEEEKIVWKGYNIKKDESKNIEIKCSAFDKDCLFPIEVSITSDSIESDITVEKMLIDENEIEEYEVRKIVEVEDFTIKAE